MVSMSIPRSPEGLIEFLLPPLVLIVEEAQI